MRHGGEDDLGTAQPRQLGGGVGGLDVDVVRRAELPGERLLVLSHGVDHADHLVPRDAREGDAGPEAILGHRVAVADAAGPNLDPHGPWSRVGDRLRSTSSRGPPGRETWATRIVIMMLFLSLYIMLLLVSRSRRYFCLFG